MPKVVTLPHGEWGKDAADWPGTSEQWRERLRQAEREAETQTAGRFHLLTPEEMAALPLAEYRIKQVLPATGVAVIYGAPKSGKTFLVMDAAAAIVEGRDWFGYRTRVAPVVYVGLEGQAGLAQRWQAYTRIKGQARQADLRFVTAPWSILAAGDLGALAEAVRAAKCAGGVVIVDTLNAASPGADENSSVDMGRIIDGAKQLQREVGGLIWLVHHAGKDSGRGLRGHSSLTGAVDAIIEVSRDETGDRREWRVERAKDGPESDPWPFTLPVVELGADGDGDLITSCVVEPKERAEEPLKRRKPPSGNNMRVALDALGVALKASTDYGMGGAPGFRPCVSWEKAVEVVTPRMATDAKHRKQRAQEAINSLLGKGHLAFHDGWVWLP